ncbi:hypothetical protein CLV48_109140 [Cecembia rubra]|uniref:Uncharacterized protein n=1 Tax=Cecembia rubra TaxID=1485585 RepID=A0A2P8DZP8_9BACT|nr:hypothetical protein CLV48_109140 [Cecembia rubra]
MDFKAFPYGFTKSMKVINPFYIRFWFLLGVKLYLFILSCGGSVMLQEDESY